MSIRSASFYATYTTSIEEDAGTKQYEETYRVLVGHEPDYVGIYVWDFGYIDNAYDNIVSEIGSASITSVQLSFKYKNNDDTIRLSIFGYSGADPRSISGSIVLNGISATELATAEISSTNKTGVTTSLDDDNNFYYDCQLQIAERGTITLALKRHSSFVTTPGSVEISGQTLVYGGSDWRDADSGEPIDPPLIILTYEITEESHPTLDMKYTTSDPSTDQSSPINSLGRYVAPNDVYPSSLIKESISSTQTTIPIDPESSLPTDVGLGSVGPEVFRYSNIDSANHQLTGVVRGISPQSSFPAGFDSFKNAERVYHLNDLNRLFDTRPASGLIQYRCVAITNSDADSNFNIQDGAIGISQDPDSNVQIRIGVEVPRFDSRSGVAVDGNNNTSSTLLVTTIVEEDGHFDGALIKFLNPTEYALADSYAIDSGTYGEFILDRTVSGLVATRSFVILPAPAQSVPNDAASPSTNSGRFTGFQEDASGISISLEEHGVTIQENDLFYVWLRRTLNPNVEASNDTGAVLIFRYRGVS